MPLGVVNVMCVFGVPLGMVNVMYIFGVPLGVRTCLMFTIVTGVELLYNAVSVYPTARGSSHGHTQTLFFGISFPVRSLRSTEEGHPSYTQVLIAHLFYP